MPSATPSSTACRPRNFALRSRNSSASRSREKCARSISSFQDAPPGADPESILAIMAKDSGFAAIAAPRNDGKLSLSDRLSIRADVPRSRWRFEAADRFRNDMFRQPQHYAREIDRKRDGNQKHHIDR